jgi:hypothetical protein
LLLFSAIERFIHGLHVLDTDTFKTANPFIAGEGNPEMELPFRGCYSSGGRIGWLTHGFLSCAGWLLSAYLLGGFGDVTKGCNGVGNVVITAAK